MNAEKITTIIVLTIITVSTLSFFVSWIVSDYKEDKEKKNL